ncbi:MAG: diacylglycerol/lipid kinase family protein [Jatrophihabitans sp.]
MTVRRIALVVNPASGVGRAARIASVVADRLGAAATVEVHQGSSAQESRQLITAVAEASDAVVVLGGDGIVHLAAQSLALGDTPLGIVPAGTGNDVADSLGLPPEPLAAADAALTALDANSVRRIDLGRTDAGRW